MTGSGRGLTGSMMSTVLSIKVTRSNGSERSSSAAPIGLGAGSRPRPGRDATQASSTIASAEEPGTSIRERKRRITSILPDWTGWVSPIEAPRAQSLLTTIMTTPENPNHPICERVLELSEIHQALADPSRRPTTRGHSRRTPP